MARTRPVGQILEVTKSQSLSNYCTLGRKLIKKLYLEQVGYAPCTINKNLMWAPWYLRKHTNPQVGCRSHGVSEILTSILTNIPSRVAKRTSVSSQNVIATITLISLIWDKMLYCPLQFNAEPTNPDLRRNYIWPCRPCQGNNFQQCSSSTTVAESKEQQNIEQS
jgi:hypothetical protein